MRRSMKVVTSCTVVVRYCDFYCQSVSLLKLLRCSARRHWLYFYHATACNARHGIAVAILSVRLSEVCIVTKQNNLLSVSQHHTVNFADVVTAVARSLCVS